jgi:S-adenosylmethionine decarboxylase
LDSTSTHLLAEYLGCDSRVLGDIDVLRELLRRAAEAAGAEVVGEVFHRYAPQGVAGVLVLRESHVSIHSWPEYGYAAVDFFTCGDCRPERADDVLRAGLRATSGELLWVERGRRDQPRSMRLAPRGV